MTQFWHFLVFLQKYVDKQYPNAHRNGTVCHIESWPMRRSNIKVEEIDHLSKPEAVNHVAHSSSKYQAKGCGNPRVALDLFRIQIKNNSKGQRVNCQEEEGSNTSGLASKQAKSTARVPDVSERKKTWNNLQVFIKRKNLQNNPFRYLINQDCDANNNKESCVRIVQLIEPNPDKPEQKKQNLSRKHERTKTRKKECHFVLSVFRVFVIVL